MLRAACTDKCACELMDPVWETRLPFIAAGDASMPQKQVLVVFGDRRRPVVVNCSTEGDANSRTKEEYEWLMKSVATRFEDVLNSAEGSSTSEFGGFYLQVESCEWGGCMIDVTSSTVIPDHGIVFLHRQSDGQKETEKV